MRRRIDLAQARRYNSDVSEPNPPTQSPPINPWTDEPIDPAALVPLPVDDGIGSTAPRARIRRSSGLLPTGPSGEGAGIGDLKSQLNKEQLEAVLHEGGPLLIFAGAGSGKTRVLTYRLAHLIQERGEDAGSILAVTFTNKAANEMKERVRHLIGSAARGLWIGTFHAICARILRSEIGRLGFQSNFVVFDDGDQQTVMKECLRALSLDMETYPPRQMLGIISRAKESMVDEDAFARAGTTPSDRTNARVYRAYQERLRSNNALDFDDLIYLTVQALEQFSDVRERYQAKFRHILVDEFQDVNYGQYRLIQILAARWRNVVCVGDDDQSIYGWRGADVGLILRFESEFSDARVIKLEQNYRCSSSILDCANHVVRHNRERSDKTLWTENAEGSPILLKKAEDEREEARFVTETIAREAAESGREWSDFGVLYRTNAQSRVLEEAFRGRQIPYRMVGGQRFYERKEIKDLVSYLRTIYNPDDRLSTMRAIAAPSRGIGPAALERVNDFAEPEGLSLYAAMLRADEISGLNARVRTAAIEFARLIQEMRRLQEATPVGDLIERVIDRSGYAAELRSQHTPEAQERLQNINELLSTARQFERDSEDSSLRAFLENLALASDLDTYQEGANAVTLMTLHSAKGLEFPVVFLVGLEEDLFPSQRSRDRQQSLEEERRLCYVGLTRAREKLYLSHANSRMMAGRTSRTRPSRFLHEMREYLTTEEPSERSSPTHAGLFPNSFISGTERARRADLDRAIMDARIGKGTRSGSSGSSPSASPETGTERGGWMASSGGAAGAAPTSFKVGEKVRHASFGIGMVVQVAADAGTISIAFEGRGVKKFQLGAAPIEKL